jgi:hypothetical protein
MNGWLIVLICLQVVGVGVSIGRGDRATLVANLAHSLVLWGILYMAGIGAIM